MKEARFKVGDKVRILDGSKIKDYAGRWVSCMSNYVGETREIERVINTRSDWGPMSYKLKNAGGYTYDERGLTSINESIIIYRKGNEVIAVDKTSGKSAKAKCSPKDTFDFVTGAKFAFDRLINPYKFKVGDRVIGNEKASEQYGITRTGWKGYVIRVYDESRIRVSINETGCDGFDVEADCFDLLKEDSIKVGDEVKIIDTGEAFTTAVACVTAHVSDADEVARYAYGDDLGYHDGIRERSEVYKVLHIFDNGAAYIELEDFPQKCYLIGLNGLKKC